MRADWCSLASVFCPKDLIAVKEDFANFHLQLTGKEHNVSVEMMKANLSDSLVAKVALAAVLVALVFAGLKISKSQITTNIPGTSTPTPKPKPSPKPEKCGLENCHGLELSCGPNVPDVCTSLYQLGDNCRKYARCEVVNNQCQLTTQPQFTECKSCVEKCLADFPEDPVKTSACEGQCYNSDSTPEP